MAFKRKVAQAVSGVSHRAHSWRLQRWRSWLAIVALIMLSWLPAATASTEGVLVLSAGPLDALAGFTVRAPAGSPPQLEESSAFALQLDDGSLATYSDLVVLPGGHLLLGDGSGRGFVLFDEAGNEALSLFSAGQMNAPSSVVVSRYLSPNQPELLLMGDDTVGRVHTYDLLDLSYQGTRTFTLDGQRARVARALRLPEERMAAAIFWPTLAMSAIEVWPLQPGGEPLLSLYSSPNPLRPEAIIDPELHPLRDLMADGDGRLLVTSSQRLAIFDAAGEALWEVDIASLELPGAEFQSARWLDSDYIIAATRQPGTWTSPHTNHRLLLIDPEAESPLQDRSAPLAAAPLRLETANGQGGTGTRGFFANAFESIHIDPEALQILEAPQISPAQFALNESALLGFSLANDSEEPLLLRRTELRIGPGPCDLWPAGGELPRSWWSLSHQTLQPQQSWTHEGVLVAESLEVGPWCAQLGVTFRDGTRRAIGPALTIEILASGGDPSDAGDAGDAGDISDVNNGDLDHDSDSEAEEELEGCACSASRSSSSPVLLLLLFLAIVRTRRIRTRRKGRARFQRLLR